MVNFKNIYIFLYTLKTEQRKIKKKKKNIFITNHLHTTSYHWFYPQQRQKKTRRKIVGKTIQGCHGVRELSLLYIILLIQCFISSLVYIFFLLYSFTFMMILLGSGQQKEEQNGEKHKKCVIFRNSLLYSEIVSNLSCGVELLISFFFVFWKNS